MEIMRYLAFWIDPPIYCVAGDLFDVASMQFALHYMGQTEARMRRFLHEVSRHLRVGGIFIATTMDSRVLMQLLMGHAEQSWASEMVTHISVLSVRYLHIVACVCCSFELNLERGVTHETPMPYNSWRSML